MSDRDREYVLYGSLEMDEGYFESFNSEYKGSPKRPVKRGRGSEKQAPILVMAETEKIKNPKKRHPTYRCKYFKMKVMHDLSSYTVNNIVRNILSLNSKVRTDTYTNYRRFNEVVKKYLAKIVPPEKAWKDLPWVHITISNAKRNLLNC